MKKVTIFITKLAWRWLHWRELFLPAAVHARGLVYEDAHHGCGDAVGQLPHQQDETAVDGVEVKHLPEV